MKGINLLGAGGICRIAMDILCNYPSEYHIDNIYDDALEKYNTLFNNRLITGSINEYVNSNLSNHSLYFNCLGNINAFDARIRYSKYLINKGAQSINIVHPNCFISKESVIGTGNLICSFVTIDANANLGNENIIFSHAVIEHDSKIGDLCYLSPSSIICGKVILEDQVYIGPGAVLTAGVRIGKNSVVGAGSVVLEDIPENSVYVGNPARFLKTNNLWGKK